MFRAACASGPSSFAEIVALPASVGAVVHTATTNLKFLELDYAALFAGDGRGIDPSGVSSGLRQQGMYTDTKWTLPWHVMLRMLGSVPALAFFVPLAAWVAWYAIVVARRRRAAAIRL